MTKSPRGPCPLGCGMDVALVQGQAHLGHQCDQSLNHGPQEYPYGQNDGRHPVHGSVEVDMDEDGWVAGQVVAQVGPDAWAIKSRHGQSVAYSDGLRSLQLRSGWN
jgi:hypothetical protein